MSTEQTVVAWMFEHPWMTFFIVTTAIEAIAAPFRWQKGRKR